MTAPTVTRLPGFGDEFRQGLAPLIQALQERQRIGLERRRLEIQQQTAQAQIEQAGAATAEAKSRTKTREAEFAQTQLELRAREQASEFYIGALTSEGGITPGKVVEIHQRIRNLPTDEQDEVLGFFNELTTANIQQQQAAADARRAEAEAEVSVGTQEARTRSKNLAADLAEQTFDSNVAIATAQAQQAPALAERAVVDLRIAQMAETNDPIRVARAEGLWRAGATWGEARRTAGLPKIEGGIPEDALFADRAPGGGMSEFRLKALSFSRQMVVADVAINQLVEETGGLSVLAAFQRNTRRPSVDIFINFIIDPKQRQLVQAHRQFANAFRFFVSGQQSSDKEFLSIMGQVAEQAGDDRDTIRQKRFMRRVMMQASIDAVGGEVSMDSLLDDAIIVARAERMDSSRIAYLIEQRDQARSFRELQEAGLATTIATDVDPPSEDNLASRLAFGVSLLDSITVTTPRRRAFAQ